LIAHLFDTSDANDRDPIRDFEIIEHELASFSPALIEKPMIVVATKLDATTNREHLDELRAFAKKRGLEFHAVSSASGEGIVELVRAMADALDRIPKPSMPIESEAQPVASSERDAEEARAAAAGLADDEPTLPPQDKR
jgi:GTP-binding protein